MTEQRKGGGSEKVVALIEAMLTAAAAKDPDFSHVVDAVSITYCAMLRSAGHSRMEAEALIGEVFDSDAARIWAELVGKVQREDKP